MRWLVKMKNKIKDLTVSEKVEEISKKILDNKKLILDNFDKESIYVYEFLQKQFNKNGTDITNDYVFQFVFRSYYRLDNAGLTSNFKTKYFELMEKNEVNLKEILSELYEFETLRNKKTIQFSFATKLLHTIDASNPIFDSKMLSEALILEK